MPRYLTDRPLDGARLLADVSGTGLGGSVLFLGTVRRSPADGDVTGIEYSAYEAMAEGEFDRIVEEVKARWPEAMVALRHRLGFVATGEPSIAIAVAAPHRAEAYDASRYVIEETKRRVPIWKKEHLAGGAPPRWVAAHSGGTVASHA